VDSAGNIYVADTYNNAIRKVTSAGVVTTVVGTASSRGSADGTGGAARFNYPRSTAVDAAGNVYVTDVGNETLRKITPAGVVTTLAGSPGVTGTTDGTGTAARFTSPANLAVDSSGNLYLADSGNHTIRKIAPGGVVTTLAGTAGSSGSTDATGTAALFSSPSGVAVDSAGNIYVADTGNYTIRKITSAGVVTTLAGAAATSGSVDAAASAARFASPTSVAVDSGGNVYVTDTGNDTIRKVTSVGVVTTLAGMSGTAGHLDGAGTAAQFSTPNGLAVDGAGNVYVADTSNDTIRKITPGGTVTTLAGIVGSIGYADGTGSTARFSRPLGLSVDGQGNLYVADTNNNTVRKVTPDGVVTTLAGLGFVGSKGSVDGVGGSARFNEPIGVAVDSGGNIYVGDMFNATVRKITPDGMVNTLAGSPGWQGSVNGVGNAALFFLPFGVAADTSGNVYVADAYNATVRKITSDGTVTTLAGMAGSRGSTDGTGSDALFYKPSSVVVDPSGNIFVADTANNLIRKITSGGVVTTFAGLAGYSGNADGVGSTARFSSPAGVAVDAVGNLYVADTGNDTIRRVATDQTVTTIAGFPGSVGSQDGTGSAALFYSPSALAVDRAGNIYVADTANNAIRKITAAGVVTTVGGVPGATGSADGTGSGALFNVPGGIAVDSSGNLYVADTLNNTIRKGTLAAGSTGSGSNSAASSSGSSGTTGGSSGSGSSGTSTSSDGSSNASSSSSSSSASGTGSSGSTSTAGVAGQFLFPTAVAEDASGNLYVADASNNVIREITPAGVISTLAGSAGVAGLLDGTGTSALFNQPNGVAVDSTGNVYVTDTGNGVIRKITPAGAVSTLAGASANRGNVDGAGSSASFSHPLGLAVDGSGNLYVADAFTNTIRKITSGGSVTTLAGAAATRGDADGTGTGALFNYPAGVAVDTAGNVYVADAYNDTVRKITPAGVVSTLAGSAGVSGANDGTGIYGLFNQPMGVAVDSAGNVYVADTSNATIRKVTPAGVVSTLAGAAGVAALMDGTGTSALFNQPHGVRVDSSGTLYVADTGNAVIRKITSGGVVTTLTLTTAATTSAASASGSSATGTVTSTAGGSGGGGGAMEPWFIGALALMGMARWMQRKSRPSA
jgi:sugar lactone lactonase YvrE